MVDCCFVSDLHGDSKRYERFFHRIRHQPPDIVFMGGDLLPHGYYAPTEEEPGFIRQVLIDGFRALKEELKDRYPRVYLILGNDDPRINEEIINTAGRHYGLWQYIHNRKVSYGRYNIYGYAFIPPSPFGLKDWEKYDVSRFVDPGCIHPYQGMRSIAADYDIEYSNIKQDLDKLAGEGELERSVFLFHSPPYNTPLDRAALDGKMVDYVPLDVHVGSIAIQRFIEARQPMLTLHGHIHEASRLTGRWRSRIGNTWMFNASVDTSQLALIRFDLAEPGNATRELIGPV